VALQGGKEGTYGNKEQGSNYGKGSYYKLLKVCIDKFIHF